MLLSLIILVPLIGGLLCLAVRHRTAWQWLNLLAFVVVAALAATIAAEVLARGTITALGGFLRADALSALVVVLTAFVAVVSGIYAIGYFGRDARAGRISEAQLRRYYTLTPVFVSMMLLFPLADSLGVMWVAAEATTLAAVLLVTFYNQKTSFEAGWKYIIIGSVGISLALFGTVMTYYAAASVISSHTEHGMNWSLLVGVADKFDKPAMRLAFICVLLGYGTKAGLVPMHTWKPDAYEQAPVPTAALFGAGVINCAIYGIARFNVLAEKCLGHAFPSGLLVGFGLASILLAAPFILAQRNFRRILAYSSIDHAGIMVAALGFGGKLGALGAMLHMLFHAVTKPLMFFCAGNVQQEFNSTYFRKIRGVIHVLPWTGGLFLMATLAVTGTPPFSIFQSEFKILSAALAAGRSWAAFLFVAGVVTVFAGFLMHMARLNLGKPQLAPAKASECPWKLGAMAAVAAPVIALGLWMPAPLYRLVEQTTHIIGGVP